jgi:RNA polymerase sigma factor (sigma-70 family)
MESGLLAKPVRMPLPPSRLGDERLARLVAEGSEHAFATLYERYHRPLYRYCRSLLHDDLDAQDALQSTFTNAFAALREQRRNAPLRPWLFRIAHNEAISMLRRGQPSTEERRAMLSGDAASAEDRAAERARLAQLVADLEQLPDRQRAALTMRELSGLSHVEIANALQTTVSAAKQAIFDARRSLLDLAEAREMTCEDIQRTISDGDGRAMRRRSVRAHLRGCRECMTFAAAIRTRRADLRALAPVLAPAASAALFARIIANAPGHAAHGTAAVGTASAAGKIGGGLVASKALASAVVVVATAAGVIGISRLVPGGSVHHRSVAHPARASAPSTGGATAMSAGHHLGSTHRTATTRSGPPTHTATRGKQKGSTAATHSRRASVHRERSHSSSAPLATPVQGATHHGPPASVPVRTRAHGAPSHGHSQAISHSHRAAQRHQKSSSGHVGHKKLTTQLPGLPPGRGLSQTKPRTKSRTKLPQ